MAEFALIAPTVFLLLMSIVVVGIVITNFIQVTNVARQGARLAAICASQPSPGTIPDGSSRTCDVTNIQAFMESQLSAVPAGSVTPTIEVCSNGTSTSSCSTSSSSSKNPLTNISQGVCNTGQLIQVQMQYSQPLYLPLVAGFFETNSNGTRLLQAQAEAACE
jgi:Flp pilus assembly protein TadG